MGEEEPKKRDLVIIVPGSTVPKWASPERARLFWIKEIDSFVVKWGEAGRVVAGRIGDESIDKLLEYGRRISAEITPKRVMEILMSLKDEGYITLELV